MKIKRRYIPVLIVFILCGIPLISLHLCIGIKANLAYKQIDKFTQKNIEYILVSPKRKFLEYPEKRKREELYSLTEDEIKYFILITQVMEVYSRNHEIFTGNYYLEVKLLSGKIIDFEIEFDMDEKTVILSSNSWTFKSNAFKFFKRLGNINNLQ